MTFEKACECYEKNRVVKDKDGFSYYIIGVNRLNETLELAKTNANPFFDRPKVNVRADGLSEV